MARIWHTMINTAYISIPVSPLNPVPPQCGTLVEDEDRGVDCSKDGKPPPVEDGQVDLVVGSGGACTRMVYDHF